MIYVTQRHFKSQRSNAETDGRIEADLRTGIPAGGTGIRYQPQWLEAIYELLVNKRSNMQFGIETDFRYTCTRVRSQEAAGLFAESWKAFMPLVKFVLED